MEVSETEETVVVDSDSESETETVVPKAKPVKSDSDQEEDIVIDSDSESETVVPKAKSEPKKAKSEPKAKTTKGKAKKVEKSDVESETEEKSESEHEVSDEKKRVVKGCVPMDLVRQVMKHSEFPEGAINQTKVKTILDLFIKTVVENVKNGDNVTLTNYMTFKRTLRAERTHKIPKTDNTVTKPAHMVMTIDIKPALKKEFEAIPVTDK